MSRHEVGDLVQVDHSALTRKGEIAGMIGRVVTVQTPYYRIKTRGHGNLTVHMDGVSAYDPASEIRRAVFSLDHDGTDEGDRYPDTPFKPYVPGIPGVVYPPREKDEKASALMALVLSRHTRWVLSIVDPQALKQAEAALEAECWIEQAEGEEVAGG